MDSKAEPQAKVGGCHWEKKAGRAWTPECVDAGLRGTVPGWAGAAQQLGRSSLLGPLPSPLIQASQDGFFVWRCGLHGLGREVICLPPAAGCQLTSANQLHFHCH